MANSKITALTALTGANSAPLDLLTLVDVSDATMAASGTNKSITRQELQTYNAGTLTTDVKVLDLSVTWNAAGVTFTGLKFNATSTASAANSLLADFQIGGSTAVAIDKAGFLQISPKTSPYYIWYIDASRYMATASASYLQIGNTGIAVNVSNSHLYLAGDINFQSTFAVTGGNVDLIVARDAANTLAIRNSTNAQTLRLYNTYTDASNYERGFKRFASNVLEIGVEVAGTGTARNMDLLNAGVSTASRVQMGTSTGRAPIVGTANVNNTAVGNAGSGEDDLITYSLPANSLSGNGKGVHITAWGTTANNANAKTLKLYFGAVMLTNSLTVNLAGVWRIEADVFRTGSNAQDYVSQLVTTGAAGVALNDIEVGSLTQTDSGAITIKCTGEATSDNDIVQEGLFVKFIN